MKLFLIFSILYLITAQKIALAKAESTEASHLRLSASSTKELENNYQVKELVDFANYNSRYFKTTDKLFSAVAITAPKKKDREFLSQLKKSFFKRKLYLLQYKYLRNNTIQVLSKKDKAVIVVKDFEKGIYTYNGRLVQFDWNKTIEDNLLALVKEIKSTEKTSLTAPVHFFVELIFPSVYANPVALIPITLRVVPTTINFFKSALSATRLKDVALWMFAFQTVNVCHDDFKKADLEAGSFLTCIGAGVLWPFYWGFKASKSLITDAIALDIPSSPLENILKLTDFSCPAKNKKEKRMKISFSGEGVFLDVAVNYDENLNPVNIVVSEGLKESAKEESAKMFINKRFEKQAVRKLKKDSFFDIEESALLDSAKNFSDFCKESPDYAEKTLKQMIKNTTAGVDVAQEPAGNIKIQIDQSSGKEGSR